jgi:hypothetical protein
MGQIAKPDLSGRIGQDAIIVLSRTSISVGNFAESADLNIHRDRLNIRHRIDIEHPAEPDFPMVVQRDTPARSPLCGWLLTLAVTDGVDRESLGFELGGLLRDFRRGCQCSGGGMDNLVHASILTTLGLEFFDRLADDFLGTGVFMVRFEHLTE